MYRDHSPGETWWSTAATRLGAQFTPGIRLFLATVLLVLGVALALGSSLESHDTQLIADEGILTTGEVLEIHEVQRNLRIIQVNETIRFTTEDGRTFEETLTDCGERTPDPPGGIVQIKYARSDPEAVQFAELACRKVSDSTSFVAAGIVSLAAAALMFGSAWHGYRARHRR